MKRVRSLLEATIVVAACFLKIFPFSGILFGLIAVILLSRFSGSNHFADWFRRPKSWGRVLAIAALATIGSMAITFSVIALCRAFSIGGPDYSRFLNVKGNVKLLVLGFAVVWSFAAFGEEIIGRGFLIDRLSLALHDSDYAAVVAVAVSSVVFGLVHFYQGVTGILDNTFTGLIFGAVYLKQNRILWATVLAHGLIDSIALVALYFGVLP